MEKLYGMVRKMDFKELNDLISIREYISISIGNPSIDRKTITGMNHLLLLVDKKIISLLMSDEFKKYVGYANLQDVLEDVRKITNIKSGLQK